MFFRRFFQEKKRSGELEQHLQTATQTIERLKTKQQEAEQTLHRVQSEFDLTQRILSQFTSFFRSLEMTQVSLNGLVKSMTEQRDQAFKTQRIFIENQ